MSESIQLYSKLYRDTSLPANISSIRKLLINTYRFSVVHMSEHLNTTLAKHKDRHWDGLHQLDRVQVVQTPQHRRIVSPIVHCPLGNAQASNTNTPRQLPGYSTSTYLPSRFLVLMSSFYDRFPCLNGHFGAISRLMLSVHCKFREGRAV